MQPYTSISNLFLHHYELIYPSGLRELGTTSISQLRLYTMMSYCENKQNLNVSLR